MNYKLYFEGTVDDNIFEKIKEEVNKIGHYGLVERDVNEIVDYANSIDSKDILLIGMGGSVVGARAIYNFLKSREVLDRRLHFLDTTQPATISNTLNSLDIDKTHLVIVSKSGTTLEVISIMNHILSLKKDKSNMTIITGEDNGLKDFANENNIKTFNVPNNVSGRFSVLSDVGLVPLALAGVNIKELLNGAKNISYDFFNKGETYSNILTKAKYYFDNSSKVKSNCIFSYFSPLEGFNKWYVQLWAESLGKINGEGNKVGLTPIGLVGPEDQHSFLQLLQEGPEDKSVTFIGINEDFDIKLEETFINPPGVDLKGTSFKNIIVTQMDSIVDSMKDHTSNPVDVIELDGVNENSIGSLIFYFELLTSCVGTLMNINTYNQPGVEVGKKIFKEKFNK